MCRSNKQRLVTKSSTESEFVGDSDCLPNTIYVQMFLEEGQGIKIEFTSFEQDNQSTIRHVCSRTAASRLGSDHATSPSAIFGSQTD